MTVGDGSPDERQPLLDPAGEDGTLNKSTYSSVSVVATEERPETSDEQIEDVEAAKERDGNKRMAKLVSVLHFSADYS